jgi:hypothetical protein
METLGELNLFAIAAVAGRERWQHRGLGVYELWLVFENEGPLGGPVADRRGSGNEAAFKRGKS